MDKEYIIKINDEEFKVDKEIYNLLLPFSDYIKELQQENKKQKEVLDRLRVLIQNEQYKNRCHCNSCNYYFLKELLEILKEVSDE